MPLTGTLSRPQRAVSSPRPRAAEFFAGIGLVRQALEQENWQVVFANDNEPFKREMYAANFPESDFLLDDIRNIDHSLLPNVDLITASFPCTDLSLAGNREGLSGSESGLFWTFAKLLESMKERRPPLLLLENVPSLGTTAGGRDLQALIEAMNGIGYSCDVITLDARYFVPQSRPRLFVVGVKKSLPLPGRDFLVSPLRPTWLLDFTIKNPELQMHALPLTPPGAEETSLDRAIEELMRNDERWWDAARTEKFISSLSPIQADRLETLKATKHTSWATAFRRTRKGRSVWEIRGDSISGCLRATRGGSSKQALVEAGLGTVQIRWLTAREYAALQGVEDYSIPSTVTENQALFGFGDAVCVPAVAWLVRNYLTPTLANIDAAPEQHESSARGLV
jgi:DNA (cytosine-5)-methyltransferase 1